MVKYKENSKKIENILQYFAKLMQHTRCNKSDRKMCCNKSDRKAKKESQRINL